MKKAFSLLTVITILLLGCTSPKNEPDPAGVTKLVDSFQAAAREGSTEGIMTLFDDGPSILFVGGDSAEIWKGKDQIRGHLNSMFPKEKVILDMKRTEVDTYQGTAWVFADGYIDIDLGDGQRVHAPYRYTMALVHGAGGWKIRMYTGSQPGSGS